MTTLAMATPATAEVVVTKAHLPISGGDGLNLDLNHDGVTDVAFSIFSYQDFSPSFRCSFNVGAGTGGGIVAGPEGGSRSYVSALARGAKIGPSRRFVNNLSGEIIERSFGDHVTGRTTFRTLRGQWGGTPTNAFIGVKFLIQGETHYGWVRLTVSSFGRAFSLHGTITGYAYETVPNKPIFAGTAEKPTAEVQVPESIQNQDGPSLGMLALGADGLSLWRREEALNLKS